MVFPEIGKWGAVGFLHDRQPEEVQWNRPRGMGDRYLRLSCARMEPHPKSKAFLWACWPMSTAKESPMARIARHTKRGRPSNSGRKHCKCLSSDDWKAIRNALRMARLAVTWKQYLVVISQVVISTKNRNMSPGLRLSKDNMLPGVNSLVMYERLAIQLFIALGLMIRRK